MSDELNAVLKAHYYVARAIEREERKDSKDESDYARIDGLEQGRVEIEKVIIERFYSE